MEAAGRAVAGSLVASHSLAVPRMGDPRQSHDHQRRHRGRLARPPARKGDQEHEAGTQARDSPAISNGADQPQSHRADARSRGPRRQPRTQRSACAAGRASSVASDDAYHLTQLASPRLDRTPPGGSEAALPLARDVVPARRPPVARRVGTTREEPPAAVLVVMRKIPWLAWVEQFPAKATREIASRDKPLPPTPLRTMRSHAAGIDQLRSDRRQSRLPHRSERQQTVFQPGKSGIAASSLPQRSASIQAHRSSGGNIPKGGSTPGRWKKTRYAGCLCGAAARDHKDDSPRRAPLHRVGHGRTAPRRQPRQAIEKSLSASSPGVPRDQLIDGSTPSASQDGRLEQLELEFARTGCRRVG